MKKILVILGTRPEAIKMCPLIKELKKNKNAEVKLLSTGQHKSMLDDVLKIENVKVDYDLSLMKKGQTLSYLTEEILNRAGEILDELLPDFVLVHGDTVSAFAGSLAAFYRKIPIGHAEAGLRTFDNENPYPEEFNRCAIAKMATYHFAPTKLNCKNLMREGVEKSRIFITGNTVIDALVKNLTKKYSHEHLPNEDFVILTAHRRESLGKDMENVFSAVKRIAEELKVKIIYPIHENEKILHLAKKTFEGSENVKIIPPLRVDDFHNFLSRSKFVITDSGGVQEEAAFLGKPLLITRKCTERKELLSKSAFILTGSDERRIFNESEKLLLNGKYYKKIAKPSSDFGNGTASVKIAKHIYSVLHI